MRRSRRLFILLAQHLLVAAAYGLCVAIAAGTVPGLIASAALLALTLLREREQLPLAS